MSKFFLDVMAILIMVLLPTSEMVIVNNDNTNNDGTGDWGQSSMKYESKTINVLRIIDTDE